MPRPGPRPYECVRRAWHSDRHQPIRGSLIQHIFRLAREAHNPATLNNKEWLEKLPLVVLKTEEILYSKANSEAEYLDLNSLWERANDAIDTIIRRDDSPEETQGDLLQPCIEAALNLGCIPRRASRSQRHNNPGICYLSSVSKEASSDPQSSWSQLQAWLSAFVANNKLNQFGNGVDSVVTGNASFEPTDTAALSKSGTDVALTMMESPSTYHDGGVSLPVGIYDCQSSGRAYPLWYGCDQPKPNTQPSLLNLQDPQENRIGSLPSIYEDGINFLHDFIGGGHAEDSLNTNSLCREATGKLASSRCDLSLRLGMFSPPSFDGESAWSPEVEDVGSSSSCNGSKYSSPSFRGARTVNLETSFSSSKDKGFDLESCSSKWSSEEDVIAIRQCL